MLFAQIKFLRKFPNLQVAKLAIYKHSIFASVLFLSDLIKHYLVSSQEYMFLGFALENNILYL